MSGLAETHEHGDGQLEYDSRYLLGIIWFNQGDYFEAHEVWEELWMDCPATERRFYQSLIQAAVALYHWGNGNRAGATRLQQSGRRYMQPFAPFHRGLDVERFWALVDAELATEPRTVRDGLNLPRIELAPPPNRWPDPSDPPKPHGASHD